MEIDPTGGLPPERDHVFATRPGPGVRDAANLWIEEETGAFAMRVGVEGLADRWDEHEIWLDIAFPDGRVLSARDRLHSRPAIDERGLPTILGSGPLALRCIAPFRHWNATLDHHPLTELTADELIAGIWPASPPLRRTAFDIDLHPAAPPLISGTLTAESRALMAGEQGGFISPRFEQLCRVEGSLTIDGAERRFRGQALRIKRQGVRTLGGFWGHCWMSALFPSGKAFGVNVFPDREGKANFNEGFVFDGAGSLKPARAVRVPWLRALQARGEPVPLVLETEDGQVSIEGTTFIACRSRGHAELPAGFPIVQQAHATYRWDGEEATGMIERSTLPDEMTG